MKVHARNMLRCLGVLFLVLSLFVSSEGMVSFAAYWEYGGSTVEGLSDRVHLGIASSSNVARGHVDIVVTTADELEEAIVVAGDGAVIEIGSDIYLDKPIEIQKSVTLVASEEAGEVSLYSYEDKRHFVVSGGEIYFTTENVIIDGENFGGGIESSAEHLILDTVICNTKNSFYGAVCIPGSGDLTIDGGEFFNNTAGSGGAIAFRWNLSNSLTINEGQFYNNIAKFGGAIYTSGNLLINGGEFYNNVAITGGAFYLEGGLIINGGQIYSNTATSDGGAFYQGSSESGEINGGQIYDNTAKDGGAIYHSSDLTINGGQIYENVSTNYGGAIYNFGKLTIKDGAIYANTAEYGGAIYVHRTLSLLINGGEMYDNIADYEGGAVYTSGHATGLVNGGEFYNNTAGRVGGAFSSNGALIVNGGEFYGNTAENGGAFYINPYWSEGGAIEAVEINDGKFYNNIAEAGGAFYIYPTSQSVEINGGEIYNNRAEIGGGIYGYTGSTIIIDNATIYNNITATNGGGIYVEDLSNVEISNSIVKNNQTFQAFQMTDEEDIALHNQNIAANVVWTDGFDYIYNNMDVGYMKGISLNTHRVDVFEHFEDGAKVKLYEQYVAEGKPFHYEFIVPDGYEAVISGRTGRDDIELEIDMEAGTIDIEWMPNGKAIIDILYRPIEEEQHTVTIITRYLDGVLPDESNSYQVRSGASFEQTYEALEGYEFAGISLRSYPLVDGDTKTVSIDSVNEDYTIIVKLARKSLSVKVTTHYVNGILPDETTAYSVLYGDNFAEAYEALEGYTFVGMSVRSFPCVDGDLQMIYIDEVKEDYEIIIKLDRAEYNVTIIVQYPEGTINNQVSTYSVLYGDTFLEAFEVESGYRIAAIQAEKGVDVDFQSRIVEIESVTKDMSVTIICR